MAMRRKNATKHVGALEKAQPWFNANVARQRRRAKLARLARRRQRGKR